MRTKMAALLGLTLCLTTGCGSVTNLIFDFPGDPFGGVAQDVDWIASVNPFVIIAGVLDLPFSAIIDIVLLPWTLIVGG